MDKIEKGFGFLDKALGMVEKYKIRTILKGVLIILIVAATIGFVNNPTWIFERYDEWQVKQHSEKMEKRLVNNEKVHILAEKLLYKVNADRVLVLELHNGVSSNSGLPFAKCSATYEALNEGVHPVADQYQDVNLSLMPFANKLIEQGYWCGNTEDLMKIDKALCYRMLGNDTSHFAGCVIQGIDKPLAFIFVKFKNISDGHSCNNVRDIINHNALQFALLLELNKEKR